MQTKNDFLKNEFHVDFLGGGSDERYDALREGLGKVGGIYSVCFHQPAKASCKYFHAPEVCKCHLSVYPPQKKSTEKNGENEKKGEKRKEMHGIYIYIYIHVSPSSRVWINRVCLPILLVVR